MHDDVAEHPGDGDLPLVVRLARGDRAALAALFERHAPAVRRLASGICGPQCAGDVVHEVFQRLWRCPERFDPDGRSLRTFLLIESHGCAVGLLRSDGAGRSIDPVDGFRRSAIDADVDEATLETVVHDSIAIFLMGLRFPEREAIVLACLRGHTYREVAEMLGQPEEAIKSRIRSGLSRLSTEITRHDGGTLRPSSPARRSTSRTAAAE